MEKDCPGLRDHHCTINFPALQFPVVASILIYIKQQFKQLSRRENNGEQFKSALVARLVGEMIKNCAISIDFFDSN